MRLHRLSIAIALALLPACAADPDVDVVDDGVDAAVVVDPDASASLDPLVVGGRARVTNTGGAGLSLRTGASTDDAVIRVMLEGATVLVRGGPAGDWYEVVHAGATGWAHGAYLTQVTGGEMNLLPWTADDTYRVTQGNNGPYSHSGTAAWAFDFGMPIGTPVLAAHLGTVRMVRGDSTRGGCDSAYGNDANYVVIDQGNGYESLYLHLQSTVVEVGELVSRGQVIGYSGQTGWSCGPHLHFQVQRSPDGGGGASWYKQSISDVFYDTGTAWAPPTGAWPVSKNGVSDLPREVVPGDVAPVADVAFDPHGGGAPGAWAEAMARAAAADAHRH